jgi:hypothetical protein
MNRKKQHDVEQRSNPLHRSQNPGRDPTTVQQLLSYRANLLSDLASDLLAANAIDVSAGRLLRDELRSIAANIRDLEPEIDVDGLLAKPPADGYTLEEMLTILDRR